jgi:hypothetical protein
MNKDVDLRWSMPLAGLGFLWLIFVSLAVAIGYLRRNKALEAWLKDYSIDPHAYANSFPESLSLPLPMCISPELIQIFGWCALLSVCYWVFCLVSSSRLDCAWHRHALSSLPTVLVFLLIPFGSIPIGVWLAVLTKEYAPFVAIPLGLAIFPLYALVFRRLKGTGRVVDVMSLMLGLLTLVDFLAPWWAEKSFGASLQAHDMRATLVARTIRSSNVMAAGQFVHAASLVVLLMAVVGVNRHLSFRSSIRK